MHKEAYENYLKKTSAKTAPKLSSKISSSSTNSTSSALSDLPATSAPSSAQTKLAQFSGNRSIKYYDRDSNRYKKLLSGLGLLFASNSLPYLLVESPEMEYLINLLDPKFQLPKRKKLAREVANLHEKLKTTLQADIKKAGKFCLIMDIWSRRGLSESYLGILVRYFDHASVSTKQALISLAKMEGSHSGENIKRTMDSVLIDWGIKEEDILYFVTDSGSNIVKALKECVIEFIPLIQEEEKGEDDNDEILIEEGDPNMEAEEEESENVVEIDLEDFEESEKEHFEIFGYEKRIPCIAHKLMCVVRKIIDGSKTLKPIITSATKLVKSFTQSGVNKELLLKYNNRRGLLSPSQTRWVYTFYVLNRLLESRAAVEKVVVEKKLNQVALTALQWEQIENLRDLLRYFADIINDLEGDNYPTINEVIPALKDLISKLKDKRDEPYGLSKIDIVRRELKSEIENKFAFILDPSKPNFQPAHMLATFFDPKYLKGLKPDQRDVCAKIIVSDILSKSPRPTTEADTSSTATSSSNVKYSGFFEETEETEQYVATQYDQSKILQTKLDAYLQEVLRFRDQQSSSNENDVDVFIDPIKFWAGKLSTFGDVAKYALNVLMVPASSAGIERVFSLASIVQGGQRFRLSAGSTEKELMVKVNRSYLI